MYARSLTRALKIAADLLSVLRGIPSRTLRLRALGKEIQFILSTIIAIPCPPPMQAVASPYFFFRRRNS
jgi:hypothetical protein